LEAYQLAPSKTSQRAAARKIKDRWRAKNWYRVLAPDMFEGVQIGETLADNPDKLKGRIMDVTLQQLTGDFSKMHIKLYFKINNISGSDAYSNFIGHSLTSDYIRRLTRRKRSKMDGIYDATTKDGFNIRVKPFAVTEKRIQTSQQYAIRTKMKDIIVNEASQKLVSEFIRGMLSGELSSKIFKECKPIYPIKRVEIRRSQITGIPAHGPEMVLPEPEPIPEEVEEVREVREVEVTEEVEPVPELEPLPESAGETTDKESNVDVAEEKKAKKTKTTKTTKTTKATKTTKTTKTTKKATTKKKPTKKEE
jgi:small subunit ribosomal protein S3Ae